MICIQNVIYNKIYKTIKFSLINKIKSFNWSKKRIKSVYKYILSFANFLRKHNKFPLWKKQGAKIKKKKKENQSTKWFYTKNEDSQIIKNFTISL